MAKQGPPNVDPHGFPGMSPDPGPPLPPAPPTVPDQGYIHPGGAKPANPVTVERPGSSSSGVTP